MKLTKEELAARLNGREYLEEMGKDDIAIAEESRLFVFFGYSDDNLEIKGIIEEEISAWEGTEVEIIKINKPPYWAILDPEDKDVLAKYVVFDSFKLEAVWCPDELDTSWLIKTDAPHATFDIFEDGRLFCRGIVIAESDLLAKQE